MAAAKPKRKIVWAVDAFLPDPDAQSNVIQSLTTLSEKTGAAILPVYVFSPDQLNLSVEFTGPWVNTYKPAVEKSLRHLVERSGLKNVLPPKIIVRETASLKNAVRAIAAYAASQGAELIVSGTQGRKGLARLVLGSFAESLLLYSKVPVMVVRPEAMVTDHFQKILVPTDLGKQSIALLGSVTDLAKNLSAKVTLVHVIPHPIEPVLQSGVYLLGGGWVPVPVYMEKEKGTRKRKVEELADKLRKKGIEVSVRIETAHPSVTQAVLDVAEEEKSSLIAMAAQSGPMASALLGSITRQTIRSAPIPVWVLRSRTR
jgi:nucleotide-binding universal stress UspA family protein